MIQGSLDRCHKLLLRQNKRDMQGCSQTMTHSQAPVRSSSSSRGSKLLETNRSEADGKIR